MKSETVVFYLDDDHEDLIFFKEAASNLEAKITVNTKLHADEFLHDLHNPPPIPSVIFLDVNMPKRNGLDILSTIRDNKNFDKIPVIIFTTSDNPETIERSRQLGANLFITKPSNFSDLQKVIKYTINVNWTEVIPERFVYNLN